MSEYEHDDRSRRLVQVFTEVLRWYHDRLGTGTDHNDYRHLCTALGEISYLGERCPMLDELLAALDEGSTLSVEAWAKWLGKAAQHARHVRETIGCGYHGGPGEPLETRVERARAARRLLDGRGLDDYTVHWHSATPEKVHLFGRWGSPERYLLWADIEAERLSQRP